MTNITLTLVPEPDIEIDRTLIIAISSPPPSSQAYTITTNSSVATVRILQSAQGVFFGALSITNGPNNGAQVSRKDGPCRSGGTTVAFFDVTGNVFLGSTFSVTNNAASGIQLNGDVFDNIVTNTPWDARSGLSFHLARLKQRTELILPRR